MTLLDYAELCEYWAKHPPTHLMVAAYLGVGKESTEQQQPVQSAKSQKEAVAEILQGGGAAVVSRSIFEKSGPAPTFDFSELMSRRPAPRNPPTQKRASI